jgi:Glycosyl hydrolase family 3 N terminal domain
MAQASGQTGAGTSSDGRTQLRMELERIRQPNGGAAASPSFTPPPPAKKKPGQVAVEAENTVRPQSLPAAPADPKVDRLTGQLLLFSFRGNSPADPGSKTVRALLQSGLIAGVVLGKENILGRGQLKELLKFLASAGGPNRPFLAIREIGGASEAFPAVKDFEQWPSEQDVANKGDPQYAYSTYRSLGAALASFGFNMNFGPTLGPPNNGTDPASSFGSNPLQTGVFAKTFMLGHKEENVLAVPIVDTSAHSVRALKTILVSDPAIPVSSVMKEGSGVAPFAAYAGLVNGARFCFVSATAASAGTDIVSGFKRGCDVQVLDGGADSPATVRDQAALGLSKAIQVGELSFDTLNAAAAQVHELRQASQADWAASAARAR